MDKKEGDGKIEIQLLPTDVDKKAVGKYKNLYIFERYMKMFLFVLKLTNQLFPNYH